MADKGMKFNDVLQSHGEQAYYIANLIAVWNTNEDLLSKILALILKCSNEKAEAIFLSITGNRAKLTMIDAVTKVAIIDEATKDEFHKLITKLEKQLKYRNKIAHGLFGTDEKNELNIINRKFDLFDDPKGASILSVAELKDHWVSASENFNSLIKIHNIITKSYLDTGDKLEFLSETFKSHVEKVNSPSKTNEQENS